MVTIDSNSVNFELFFGEQMRPLIQSNQLIVFNIIFIFIFCFSNFSATSASQKIIIKGKVTDKTTGKPLASANIKVANSNLGSSSDESGNYELNLSVSEYKIIFSYIGYHSQEKTITLLPDEKSVTLNVALTQSVIPGSEVAITAQSLEPRIARFDLPPAKLITIANPLPDALISLKTLPGVASSNDQSTFYNVRGGNYDENLIYLNSVEIYQPILVRKGIAENPSLVNPYLIQSINLRTGAFPVKYGDKLSSVLDISYRNGNSQRVSGLLELSSISGNLALEGPFGKKATWIIGIRKVNYGYLFNALQTKGSYAPDFKDIQLGFTWQMNSRSQLQLFGLFGDSQFKSKPESWSSRSTRTEVTSVTMSGNEAFNYQTGAGGFQFHTQLSEKIQAQLGIASFNQWEKENSSVEYRVTSISADTTSFGNDTLCYSQLDALELNQTRLSTSLNRLFFRASAQLNQHHQVNFGMELSKYNFKDRLHQQAENLYTFEIVQPGTITSADLINSAGVSAYAEYFGQPASFVSLTTGVRFTTFDFNNERLVMPRLNVVFHLGENTDLLMAAGRYTQPPLYKEFRSTGKERSSDLKAQKSDQFTLGLERRWAENMSLRIEAYYKRLRDLISYNLWDVRLVYSGRNDAIGYVYGMDAHLRGDFIPDCLAWLSYSYMVAREDLDDNDVMNVGCRVLQTSAMCLPLHCRIKWFDSPAPDCIFGSCMPVAIIIPIER